MSHSTALTCHSTATRSRSTICLWKVLVMLPLSATLWKVQSCPTDLGSVAAPSHGANPQCCRRQTLRAQGAADQLNLVMPTEIGIQLLKYCLGLNIITSKSSRFQLPNRFSCTKHPSKTLRQCWSGTAPWSSQSCHVPDGIHGTVAMQPRIACFQVTINLDELTLGTVFDQLITLLDCHPILAGTASFGPLKFPIIHLYRTLDPAWLCPWRKTKHCMPWTWTMNISRQKCHFEPKTRGIHWERQYTMYTHQDREYYRTLKKSSPFSKFLPQWYNVDIWAQILLASVPNKSSTENFFVFQGASCFQQSAQLIPEVLGCDRDQVFFTGGFWTRELPVTLPIFSYSHWRQMVKNGEKSPNRPSVDLLQEVTCISCHCSNLGIVLLLEHLICMGILTYMDCQISWWCWCRNVGVYRVFQCACSLVRPFEGFGSYHSTPLKRCMSEGQSRPEWHVHPDYKTRKQNAWREKRHVMLI